ncbi:MAG: hypothetical protein M0C28_11665 [Candidatus Moduliflexus flocculans]|nr:hypothetical protein [Candidatus Moduliflexus flocculans]
MSRGGSTAPRHLMPSRAASARAARAGRVGGRAMASIVLLVVALAAERQRAAGSAAGAARPTAWRPGGGAAGDSAGRDVLLVQAGIGRDRARDGGGRGGTGIPACRRRGRSASPAASASGSVRVTWSFPLWCWTTRSARRRTAGVRTPPTPTVCAALRRAARVRSTRAALLYGNRRSSGRRRTSALRADGAGRWPWRWKPRASHARRRVSGSRGRPSRPSWTPLDDPLPLFLAACTSPQVDLRWRGLLAGAADGAETPGARAAAGWGESSRSAAATCRQGSGSRPSERGPP